MKRIALVLCLLLSISLAKPASAHNLSVVAALSLKDGAVTLRMIDPYGAPVEGLNVTVAAALPKGKPGSRIKFAEGPAGTYTGAVTPPVQSGVYDLYIEATILEDFFRITVPVEVGETRPEMLIPMQAVEPPAGFNWGPILYGVAAVVLATATAVAVLRKRQADDAAE